MDIYQRKREANLLARQLIEKAVEQGKEVEIEKLVYEVCDTYPVPEKPLTKAIHLYVGMQEGISISAGIIKKDD